MVRRRRHCNNAVIHLRQYAFHLAPLYSGSETISLTSDRCDRALAVKEWIESFAQHGDGLENIAFFDEGSGPDIVQNLGLGNDTTVLAHQIMEQVESFCPERDRISIAGQSPLRRIEYEPPKAISHASPRGSQAHFITIPKNMGRTYAKTLARRHFAEPHNEPPGISMVRCYVSRMPGVFEKCSQKFSKTKSAVFD